MQGEVRFNIEEVQRKGGSMQLENLQILRIRVEKRKLGRRQASHCDLHCGGDGDGKAQVWFPHGELSAWKTRWEKGVDR